MYLKEHAMKNGKEAETSLFHDLATRWECLLSLRCDHLIP